MNKVKQEFIPECLKALPSWVLWKIAQRSKGDKPTKLPFTVTGQMAKADDPATWTTFEKVHGRYVCGGYAGIGFEFSADDAYCGIDLDGCRNPATNEYAPWAREIIVTLNTYAEVSPSGTGVKLFVVAKSPMEKGKKLLLPDAQRMTDDEKVPAIEIYDWGRYFAVTGLRLAGQPHEPQPRQEQLAALVKKYWPVTTFIPQQVDFHSDAAVVERARKYLAKLPPAIEGADGSGTCFHAACVVVLGFGLDEGTAMMLMGEYNQTCQPPWSEKELLHKVRSAAQQPGQRNYLRNSSPERWENIAVPQYKAPDTKSQPRITTLESAARTYYKRLQEGEQQLVDLGVAELDYAIGGGVEYGEMIVLAARPSHCKSAVALQIAHNWTGIGIPVAMISQEMSSYALGKRTLQFISDVPQEHWKTQPNEVTKHLDEYGAHRAVGLVIESCASTDIAIEQIDAAIQEHKIKAVFVDYAQILKSTGKGRYEQVTNTSIALRQLASSRGLIVVVLAQFSREIEKRDKFMPVMSDLKETGQIEQDADVVIGMVWPWKIDNKQPPNEFQFYVLKNRNRAINQGQVIAKFIPSRQMVVNPKPTDKKNYEPAFDQYEQDRKDFQ